MTGIDPAIRGLCAFSLALIFGASGVMKLRDLEMFEGSLANYQLAPSWMEKPLAYLLPIVECAAAAGLLMASTRAMAASMLLALLTIFTGAIAINLARGRTNIDCGCFGPALRQELSGWLLLRNLFLMILAAIVILPRERTRDRIARRCDNRAGRDDSGNSLCEREFRDRQCAEDTRAGDDVK